VILALPVAACRYNRKLKHTVNEVLSLRDRMEKLGVAACRYNRKLKHTVNEVLSMRDRCRSLLKTFNEQLQKSSLFDENNSDFICVLFRFSVSLQYENERIKRVALQISVDAFLWALQ
jgi:hypothetical protein